MLRAEAGDGSRAVKSQDSAFQRRRRWERLGAAARSCCVTNEPHTERSEPVHDALVSVGQGSGSSSARSSAARPSRARGSVGAAGWSGGPLSGSLLPPLAGPSSSRAVGPRGSARCWLLARGLPWFLATWSSPMWQHTTWQPALWKRASQEGGRAGAGGRGDCGLCKLISAVMSRLIFCAPFVTSQTPYVQPPLNPA